MASGDKLAAVLSGFARTMLTDFRIQTILDHLVDRIVEILDISGASVTLISADASLHYVAASGPEALRYEQLQSNAGHGPCITAYLTGEPVSVPNLAADTRYPEFSAAAAGEALAAVFTFPLCKGDVRLGALDLYRDSIGALSPEDVEAAQTLADVAAAYLINARARELVRHTTELFQVNALHDALTGLPNRLLLEQRLEHAAARAYRSHSTAAVIFADLDRFKRVNDIYGHSIGDGLLIAVARRLAIFLQAGDTLARISGDQFVILCEDVSTTLLGEALAQQISSLFDAAFRVEQTDIKVTASVGVAYCGPGEALTYQLVVNADAAMYQVKRAGGAGHDVVDLSAAQQAHNYNHLELDLRPALENSELALAYQPIVRPADGFVTGVEALLRWTHPTSGNIPTQTVINLAERSGLIVDLGAWVLEKACSDRTAWLADHPCQPLDVAVNISVRQVISAGFLETITRILDQEGMDPHALVLEVTEGIFMEHDGRAMHVLATIRALGVRLALDDFGAGYSSLSYLRRFTFDIVKIDRAFVAEIGANKTTTAIVRAITDLTHVLGLTALAEGVETNAQRDQLVNIGCDLAQGFLFAKALPDHELARHLERSATAPLRLS